MKSQRAANAERYRSGHNEAVLKTVCPKGHMGSNPILSATFFIFWLLFTHMEDYPSGEGAPLLRE